MLCFCHEMKTKTFPLLRYDFCHPKKKIIFLLFLTTFIVHSTSSSSSSRARSLRRSYMWVEWVSAKKFFSFFFIPPTTTTTIKFFSFSFFLRFSKKLLITSCNVITLRKSWRRRDAKLFAGPQNTFQYKSEDFFCFFVEFEFKKKHFQIIKPKKWRKREEEKNERKKIVTLTSRRATMWWWSERGLVFVAFFIIFFFDYFLRFFAWFYWKNSILHWCACWVKKLLWNWIEIFINRLVTHPTRETSMFFELIN